ncbi:MAG: shikimate dehydrogenase [Saprospiraceae bacterium]|nr:shikimate dehydrogenase [Saprospiraceae bacterium]
MRRFGLIGYPLGHSFSKKYFTEKFAREGITDATYNLFPLEHIADLPELLHQYPDLRGLNVTIPHKETVVPLLDELDESARAVGAVNCVKIEPRRCKGFNTDVVGFEASLLSGPGARFVARAMTVGGKEAQALILGKGGAAKAVAHVLKKLGIAYKFASRSPVSDDQISYETLCLPPSTFRPLPPLIINTTPLGMAPNVDACPDLPYERLTPEHFVYDLIYNPAETLLLQRAKAQGCSIQNGLEMLHLQAEAAWSIWSR